MNRSVSCSAIVRKIPSFVDGNTEWQVDSVQKVRDLGYFVFKGMFPSDPYSQGSENPAEEEV